MKALSQRLHAIPRTGRLAAAVGLVVASSVLLGLSLPTRATGPYAAALPSPLINAQGVGAANSNHLFVSRAWDFAQIRTAFNAVNISPGDQTAVTAAHDAGLAVILEFDYKDDFMAGKDISARVNAIVAQVQANPGTIAGLWIADRLNEKYSDTQGLSYLAATGGVFHAQIPGVPVFVDVSDWELTCNKTQQASCSSSLLNTTYQYEKNAVLQEFHDSGNIDGMFIADNLQNNNATAQSGAWATARSLWPAPFTLVSRSSQFAFPDNTYTGTKTLADAIAAAYITAPMSQGADGVDHWAWHQVFQGTISSFLNKDTSSNYIWQDLIAGANSLGLIDVTPPGVTVTSPTAGSTAVNDLILATTTTDNVGVNRVDFYVDGGYVGTSTTSPFRLQWDTHNVANGSHQFTARAFDPSGNSTLSAAVTAGVGNTGPPPTPHPTPTPTPPPTPTPHPTPTPATSSDSGAPTAAAPDVAADLGQDDGTGAGTTANSASSSAAGSTAVAQPGATHYTAKVSLPATTLIGPSPLVRSFGIGGGLLALACAVLILATLA